MTTESNLTRAQSLIWAGQQLHADVPLYNMVLAFRIAGPVDETAFTAAFAALVDGTDAMRTVFVEEAGTPRRVVLESAPAELEIADLTAGPDPEAAYTAWAEAATTARFDLGSSLYRSALIKLGDADYVWFLAQHHLITDGWAVAVVYERMEELYREAAAGELAVAPDRYPSYEAYADYERRFRDSDAFAAAQDHWDAKVDAELEELAFYGVSRAPGGTTRTDRITVALGRERMERLESLSSGDDGLMGGISQFNVFATVLLATVARTTGQSELAILAPAHNRPSPRFKATDGLFIEVLPLRATVEPTDTFRTLLDQTAVEARDFLLHARPGTSSASQNRAYSVLLNFINASLGDFNGWPMRSEWLHPGHGDSDHDLRLQVHDFDGTGELTLHFDLSRDIFDTEREKAVVRHFLALFDALLADPDQPIGAVHLLTSSEHAALAHYNDTAADVPFPTVLEAFAKQVSERPEATAVTAADGSFTYAELDAASDHLAAHLLAAAGPAPRVGIHLHRSRAMVEAIWAVLKTGGSYVPMDMQYPPERIRFLLADSGATVILTEPAAASRLGELDAITMVLPLEDAPATSPAEQRPGPEPDDTAYVMYTSGSTGQPKGVQVSHGNLVNYVWWAQSVYGRGAPVSFPLYSSFGFDLTVTSLFVPLVTGGSIAVYPEPKGSDLSVRDVFADDAVDVVKLTPAHLALLDAELLNTNRIRTLILGGEDLKTSVAHAAWQASGGRLEILNEYGPTEATVGCMLHRYDPEHDLLASVPIGTPAANAQIHVLNDALAPVPLGVVGELCIGGAGVATGYLGRPELTAERFVPDPAAPSQHLYRTGDLARWRRPGVIEFLGRADDQVKVRGYRIELGEIEAALAACSGIDESVVTVVETETEQATLSGAVDRCVRCGLTSQHPDADLDDAGVCQPCHFYDAHRADAEAYFGVPDEMAAQFPAERGRNDADQDCVMLLSGGKDSTYALYQLVEMGLTPLVFTLDNGFISEGAKANIRRAVDDLGLELVMGTTPSMNAIFADSLQLFSNVCQGCFKTVYTMGMNLAHERGLRHVVTGLSRGQIFETRLADLFRIGITDRDEVDDAILEARRAYHRVDDAVRRNLDTSLFDDDDTFEEIRIIDFYRYHDVGLDDIYSFLASRAPWVRPGDTGRSTNCLINNTGIFVHKKEKRFHNYALPYSWDVRLGHKTWAAALEELEDEIDVDEVRRILDEVGYEIEVHEDHAAGLRGRDKRIVAYYTSRDPHLTPAHVRSHLSAVLPEHAVPSYLVRLDQVPLTVNGKVDRAALPDPRRHVASDDEHYVAPRTPHEEALVDIWEAVLGVDRVGVNDAFIELGGDSILNIQAVAMAKSAGLLFTPQQLFEHQTIAALAQVVVAAPGAGNGATPSQQSDEPLSEVDLSDAELQDLLNTFGQDG